MQIIGLLVILLVMVAPDLYIFFLINSAPLALRLLHWLPFVLIALGFVGALTGFIGFSRQFMMTAIVGLFLLTALPKFIFMVVSLLGKLVSLFWDWGPAVFNWVGLACAAFIFCTAFYGFIFGWQRLVVHEKEVELEGLPEAFDGYKIVQLSDFHIGTYRMAPKWVDWIVDTANGLSPDMILFTGDLVNAHPSEAEGFIPVLSRLNAPDGVHSVMGNHDYCIYSALRSPEARAVAVRRLQEIEREAGWDLMLNESRVIRRGADSLALVGVENDGKPPFQGNGDLVKATAGLPEGIFKILMTHDPSHWRMKVLPDTDIQLTLSGHTHAAQIQIGSWSPSSWLYPEWGGFYNEGSRILHVSVGNGSNVPFRIGAWPEVVLLTLRRKE
ncbi:MAG: metallophosphoesterase [Bacteroidales bacterium]|nr:metallophosphoesterase [Bacteroidales bacterium]